jgi:hypothetical protein
MYLVYVTGKRIDYDVSHTSHNMHKTRCKMNSQSLWDRMEPLLLVGRIVVSLVAGHSRYLRKVDSQDQHNVETSSFSRVRWLLFASASSSSSRPCLTHVQLHFSCYTSAQADPLDLRITHTHLSKVLSLPSYTTTSFAWLAALPTRNPPR